VKVIRIVVTTGKSNVNNEANFWLALSNAIVCLAFVFSGKKHVILQAAVSLSHCHPHTYHLIGLAVSTLSPPTSS